MALPQKRKATVDPFALFLGYFLGSHVAHFSDSAVARALCEDSISPVMWNMGVKWSTSAFLHLLTFFPHYWQVERQKLWSDCPPSSLLTIHPFLSGPQPSCTTSSSPKSMMLSLSCRLIYPPQPHGTECSSSHIQCSLLAPSLIHSVLLLECSPCSSLKWLLLIHHLSP